MTKIEEEALGLLGAFRAACEDLCKRWEERDNDWRRDDVDDHHPDVERGMDIADATCARELRALLTQTPMDQRGLLQLELGDLDRSELIRAVGRLDSEVGILRVVVRNLSSSHADMSHRLEVLERKGKP